MMHKHWLAFGTCTAALGAAALVLTPGPRGTGYRLAAAGADVPPWLFVVVGLCLVVGLILLILGRRRRREDDDEVVAARAAEPDVASSADPVPGTGPDTTELPTRDE